MLKLSVKNVRETVLACLYAPGDDTADAIIVKGVSGTFGFCPAKVEANRKAIKELLSQFKSKFREGASLIEAPFLEDDSQWGEQAYAEHILLLGMAAGYVEQLIPYESRHIWAALPGGLPYYQINKLED